MSERLGVVGAGTMGSGIAQSFAATGFDVVVVDIADAQLARAKTTIDTSLAKLEAKGKISGAAAIAARIRFTTDFAALNESSFVIEAAFESPDVKRDLFHRLDEVCGAEAILASNTSSISISALGAATGRPERVVGMHFFNPVPVMSLVEIVRGLRTADDVVEAARDLARRGGKTPIVAKDAPGFVVNRILVPMINEAFVVLGEGTASAEDVDRAMTLGANHPLGPLALADLIGLDVCLAVLEVLHHDLGDPKYRPAPLLRRYVAAGWLGRKTGRGCFSYA